MSHDWAWSEGTRDIEIEANLDAMPDRNEYVCAECIGSFWTDEDPPTPEEQWREIPGVYRGWETILLCPACANPEFTIGQRVRFVACPSLVGVIAQRRHDDEGGWLYTVRGCAEDRILGLYRREHLEEAP